MNRIRVARSAAAACVISTLSAANAQSQVDLDGLNLPQDRLDQLKSALGQHGTQNSGSTDGELGIANYDYRWHFESSPNAFDLFKDAEIDLFGNLVFAHFSGTKTIVEKFKVSDNTLASVTQAWQPSVPGFPSKVELPGVLARDLVVDLDGNTYVVSDPNPDAIYITKISPIGSILWTTQYTDPNVSLSAAWAVAVDPDDVPFAMGSNWVARFDPVTGAIAWLKILDIPFITDGGVSPPPPKLIIDRRGAVYIGGTADSDADGDQDALLLRLNGATGDTEWTQSPDVEQSDFPGSGEYSSGTLRDFEVSLQNKVLVVHQDRSPTYPCQPGFICQNSRMRLSQYGPSGALEWRYVSYPEPETNYESSDLVVDSEGYATFFNTDSVDSPFVYVYHIAPDGPHPAPPNNANGHVWKAILGDPDQFSGIKISGVKLGLDRLGNVYCLALQDNGTGNQSLKQYVFKILKNSQVDPSGTGNTSQVWRDVRTNSNQQIYPGQLLVDAGANVFVAGALARDGLVPMYIDKISQPFVSQPTLQKAAADLQFENRSIWAPGVGNLVSQDDFFTVNWTDEGVDASDSVDVPVLGTFGGSFVFKTSGSLTGGYKAEVNGGTVDVHMPIEAKFLIPSSEKFGGGGSPVTIITDWKASDSARMTSCFTPSVNAGLTAGGNFRLRCAGSATAFSASIFNALFFDFSKIFPLDYIPNLNLLDLLALAGLPVPGEWFEFELFDGLFEGAFRTPTMMAQGRYDEKTHKFTTSANDRFFNFGLNITEAIMRAFGARLGFDFEYPLPEQPQGGGGGGGGNNNDEEEHDEADFGVRGSASALQLIARVDLAIQQDLEVQVNPPSVRYVFSDGVPTQTIPLGSPLNFTLPGGWDGELVITPIVSTSATFRNETDIQFIPGIKWRTIEGGVSLFAFGYDILTLGPWCFLCYDWDLSEILEALGVDNAAQYTNFSLNIFPLRAPTLPGQKPGAGLFPNSWSIPFPEVSLPAIRLVQGVNIQPHLIGASRSAMSMLIYDQTSPTVASFNVTANGKTKMLLYGSRFCNQPTPSTPCDVAPQAYILHYGRQEALTTTAINASTALIEVPNRFRLLPGVAKIWVVANGKTTETIDMPIEYPTPRLDAVNPNLWAADPDLADLPIAVIDAKTFRGNDTYIARRDYYIKMRNNLWNASTAGGLGAAAYFPGFNWNQMPGFPSVLWGGRDNGVPLPRFIQPVDNGIHNVRLDDGNYDRAQVVPVTLCNPSPGGGFGNTINLTIAAPIPVVNGVTPGELAPSDIEHNEQGQPQAIELTVTGPKHVPQFFGYEEPKYGNFNADSVVYFNGTALQTTFISSSRLLAMLPPNLVTIGNHAITVHTPGNGTQYFEELWTDADGDGKRDAKPVFQGLINSGGESAPFLFPIRYRQPDVSQLSPPTSVIDNAAFNLKAPTPKNPQGLNFTLQGQDFRSGAVVYFNNQPRLTTFVDKTILRARLLPQDVDVIGQFPITVRNPAPDFQASEPIFFTVKPPKPQPAVNPMPSLPAGILQKAP